MQSFYRSLRALEIPISGSKIVNFKSSYGYPISSVSGLIALEPNVSDAERRTVSSFLQRPTDISSKDLQFPLLHYCISSPSVTSRAIFGFQSGSPTSHNIDVSSASWISWKGFFKWGAIGPTFPSRCITTMGQSEESVSQDGSASIPEVAPRIKFKRLDKIAGHIMQILDKEAVEVVRAERELPDIKPGYIVQLKVEVPENKRRVSTMKGIVIARRNAGLNSTFRIRRLVAGVGVESIFPLYSPNIKEMKVLDKKKVRRAKLYYLRDKMNALKKH